MGLFGLLIAALCCTLLGTPQRATAKQSTASNDAVHACYSQLFDDNELHVTAPGTACDPGEKSLTWHKKNSNVSVDRSTYKLTLNNGNSEKEDDWWSVLLHNPQDIVLFVLSALVLLGVLVALLLTLIGLLLRWPLHWLLRCSSRLFRLLGPELVVEPFNDSAMPSNFGTSFASQVQARLGQPEMGQSLYMATGEQVPSRSLDTLQEAPQTQVLGAALALLRGTWARSRLVVNGSLRPVNNREAAAVALTLKRRSQFAATTEIRPTERPSSRMTAATSNHVLAVAAAGWVEHSLADETPGPRASEVFLSRDPQSWALFRAGAELGRISCLTEAADAYERALAIDPRNIGALIDLAHLRRREGHFEGAEILARSAISLIEARAKSSCRTQVDDDPNWYRAQIILATTYLVWARDPKTDKQQAATLRKKARRQSRAVAQKAIKSAVRIENLLGKEELERIARGAKMRRRTRLRAKPISQHQQRRRFDPNRVVELHEMLVTILEPGALLLVVASRSNPPKPDSTKTPFEIRAELADNPEKLADEVRGRRKRIVNGLESGRSVQSLSLIKYVDLLPVKGARVLYNLACHYSLMSEKAISEGPENVRQRDEQVRDACLETACEYLRQSISKLTPLERRSMFDRALEDSDLEALWKAKRPEVWALRSLLPT